MTNWQGFKKGKWQDEIDIRDFIQANYIPYEGDESFLSGPTMKTEAVWNKCQQLLAAENKKGGVLDVDTGIVSTTLSHKPGYIDRENEVIFGLQTDAPLRRGVVVNSGLRMAEQACEEYGYKLNPQISNIYSQHVKTHNEGVFALYTAEMRRARSLGLLTGLPDAYGRGRIIGDYRRIALYGVDALLKAKAADKEEMFGQPMLEATLRSRDEIAQQIQALKDLKAMAASYGFDISQPAKDAREAVQWIILVIWQRSRTKRCGDVDWPRVDLPGYLYCARYGKRPVDRSGGPGTYGSVRHQAAFGAYAAHARIQ